MSHAAWIILTGCVVGTSCAVLGCFLVLRKIAMLGDAISHAVLPGIVLAFLITASRSSLPMFIGAVAIGGLTAFVVQYLSEKGVQGDAAIGVTFTSLFAIGVVLVSVYGGQVDLDLDCVLYGEIAYVPFDVVRFHGAELGPRAIWVNGILLAVNLLVLGVLYKQFKLCAFDPETAAAVGIPVTAMHYVLMGLVAVTTVGAFERRSQLSCFSFSAGSNSLVLFDNIFLCNIFLAITALIASKPPLAVDNPAPITPPIINNPTI
jgi:manganese/zinc/iron transport system permease protein